MKKRNTVWMVFGTIIGVSQFMLAYGGMLYYRDFLKELINNDFLIELLKMMPLIALLYPAFVFIGMNKDYRRLIQLEKEASRNQNPEVIISAKPE